VTVCNGGCELVERAKESVSVTRREFVGVVFALAFSPLLFYCSILLLVSQVIGGLLKFWPILNSSKEVLFLGELEELLELTHPEVRSAAFACPSGVSFA
jgi:hypothetical protein